MSPDSQIVHKTFPLYFHNFTSQNLLPHSWPTPPPMAITTSWLSSTWCMNYIKYEAQRVPLTVIDNMAALLTLLYKDVIIVFQTVG